MTPEGRIVKAIKKALEAAGFFVLKFHGSPMQMAGIPDLLALRHGKAYFFEVKQPGKHPTPLQAAMIRRLSQYATLAVCVHGVEEALESLSGTL